MLIRCLVYNTITGIIEQYVPSTILFLRLSDHDTISQTPVLNDVRDITLAKDTKHGLVALVSYENKV